MSHRSKTVFVLGAGFTKAFLPDAPLLVDGYDIDPVLKKYKAFDKIIEILQREKDRLDDNRIDIERLLTRLEGLPFDSEETLLHFGSVKRDVHSLFLDRLKAAKSKGIKYQEELRDFAYSCLTHRATCITFNYDDVLDQTLHEVSKSLTPAPAIYWHPNSGYGFYIPPSAKCIDDPMWSNNERSAMLVHKLHGSTNWRTKLGFSRPYPIDALVHHENWNSFTYQEPSASIQFLELHLTEDVFMIPPVIAKTSLQEPITRRIWEQAYKALSEAERVTFIGYSCPVTDLAANFLFSHTLGRKGQKITVVDRHEADDREQQKLLDRYSVIIPTLTPEQFHFTGAIEWLRNSLNGSRGILSEGEGQNVARYALQLLEKEEAPKRSAQELCSKIGGANPPLYDRVIQKLLDDEIIVANDRNKLLLWRCQEDPKFKAHTTDN